MWPNIFDLWFDRMCLCLMKTRSLTNKFDRLQGSIGPPVDCA